MSWRPTWATWKAPDHLGLLSKKRREEKEEGRKGTGKKKVLRKLMLE